ncbi:hypothetical protein [Lacipirellula parvula]|nr:hypothetical protein [Lacipirellula parvula]
MRKRMLEAVTCPWCKTEFEVDPRDGAFPIQCPGCPETPSFGALRHPDLDPKALDIGHNLSTAAAQNLANQSLAFVYNKGVKDHAGSGTLVKIGNRLLIATAEHTVPKSANRITLVTKIAPDRVERAPKILHVAKSEYHDVGLIEVETDTPRLIGMEPIGIDRIADLQSGRHYCKSWMIGYPGANQMRLASAPGVVGFRGNSLGCEPIDPIAWHRIQLGRDDEALDPEAHAMFYYNISEPLFIHSENPCRDEFAAKPHGMSGGGIWQCRQSAEGRNWYPHDLCLFAIISAWNVSQEHVKAIQVIHWLRLVADTYQDLREELIDAFPRLLELPTEDIK